MNRTISEVYNYHEDRVLIAEDIFLLPEEEVYRVRNDIEHFIQDNNPLLACNVCGQAVGIRIYKDHSGYYFSHLYKSNDCPIKTGVNYSSDEILRMKYNGAKESSKHFEIKSYIAKKLTDDPRFTDIAVEKVVKGKGWSKKWKKPDISAKYRGKKVVFEIQLSTTYLDVIVSRETFYREQKIPVFWIFSEFDFENIKATHKDIFYNNWSNILSIDQGSRYLTQKEGELFFTGCYKDYSFCEEHEAILEQWCSMPISFDLIKFNSENYKPFFFNSHIIKTQEIVRMNNYLENVKPVKDLENNILINYKDMRNSGDCMMDEVYFSDRETGHSVCISHSMAMFIIYLMSIRDNHIYFAMHGYSWMANQIWNNYKKYWLFFVKSLHAYNMQDIIIANNKLNEKHEKFKYEYKNGLIKQDKKHDKIFRLFVPRLSETISN